LFIAYLCYVLLPGEPVDFSKEITGVFEPTDEWKKVEPGKWSMVVPGY